MISRFAIFVNTISIFYSYKFITIELYRNVLIIIFFFNNSRNTIHLFVNHFII